MTLKCDTVCFIKQDMSQLDRNIVCLSRSYICYCVKAGLIRAIHSSTGDKTLLRGHETPVVDLSFSSTNDSVLCTVDAGSGSVPHVFVWRLVVKESLEFEKVCTLQLPASLVIGHPLSEEIWNVSHGNEMCIFSTKLVRQESPADFSSGSRAYSDSSLSLRLQSEITGSALITFILLSDCSYGGCTLFMYRSVVFARRPSTGAYNCRQRGSGRTLFASLL